MAQVLGDPVSPTGDTNDCLSNVEPTTCRSERCDTLLQHLTDEPNNLTTPKPTGTLGSAHLNGQTEKQFKKIHRVILPQENSQQSLGYLTPFQTILIHPIPINLPVPCPYLATPSLTVTRATKIRCEFREPR
ncbi:hypothetical protein HOY82DRAFT_372024 [Tuber indicum]|nr:hypothetical protein HOY82DRAFT_372024 [Tuber indicum]